MTEHRTPALCLWILVMGPALHRLPAADRAAPDKDVPYATYVQRCIDTLIAHGTDTYGDVHAPVLVSILDVQTRACPRRPARLDEDFRVIRRDRRNPGGSNLLTDQATLKAMYALTDITGNGDYAAFADRYAAYVMTHLVDEQGFFWWGWHRHYDVFTDTRKGHNPNRAAWGARVFPHEIHAIHGIAWDRLRAVNPAAVTGEIDAVWRRHVVDKESGEINRHGDGNRGCDFTMSGGAFIEAFAFMYAKTKEQRWLDRARLIADYYWKRRDPRTDCLPERPNAGKKRFDGGSFVTTVPGLFCHSLLRAWEMTRDKRFRDYAVAYLKAYARYGYDAKSGRFRGALKLDGTPFPGPRIKRGYARYEPRGHLDLWEPYVAGYQYAIYTAQAYVYAFALTGEPVFLTTAQRFAAWIRKTPPGTPESADTWYDDYAAGPGRKGTYAGKYGRTISFLLHLYVVTGGRRWLDDARALADTAVEKLYHAGLFRGHPAKPYYEAVDGVGYLLYALLSLDRVLQDPETVVDEHAVAVKIGAGDTTMRLDNR